ncbi:MAG: hypothetical protein GX967_01235 [Clostridiales bacterium]|nr:hypothetical protein [Clostridiales bacterium]
MPSDINSVTNIQNNYEKYKDFFVDKDSSGLKVDDFLNLLVAEMTNQDPMSPMSNTDFVAQMAQFTSLQTMQDLTYYSNASFAASLVGKTVTMASVSASGEMQVETGPVQAINLNGKEFEIRVNNKFFTIKNLMEIAPTNGGGDDDGESDTVEEDESI